MMAAATEIIVRIFINCFRLLSTASCCEWLFWLFCLKRQRFCFPVSPMIRNPPKSWLYKDFRPRRHRIEERDDVVVAHPDAAVAGRRANLALVIGAVNVDVAVPRVRVVGVQPVQP